MSMESNDGMILTGVNQRTWRKTCPSATLSTTNPTWTNLALSSEKLITNHMSHVMAK
jgi:hypothetical protein